MLLKALVKSLGEKRQIDFILYIGDENMNEPAFQYLSEQKRSGFQGRISQFIATDAKVYPCTIGLKSTHANYYLEQQEINYTLKKLKEETVQRTLRPDARRVQS